MAGFDDDLGADIGAAIDSATTPASTAVASPAADAALPSDPSPDKTVAKAPEGERPRDESGKFIAKTEETKPADAKPAPVATTQAAPVATVAPPQNWKGAGKVDWNRLPLAIQQALNEDYARVAKADAELQQWGGVITPERAQALTAQYGSPQQAVKQLLAISDYAARDRPGFLRWFAQQGGIDLNQVVQGAQQGGEQPPAGDQNPLMQRVVQLQEQVQNLIAQQTQGAQTQVMSEIDAFARDPAHPYFNDVREHMGALMKAGKAANLQEAYDMATWAVPSVRTSLLEQRTQAAMQQNAQKVQQAKQAGGSITGSPAGATVAADEPERDLDAELARNVGKYFGT